MYTFCIHIKCVYSLFVFTLQKNETENIHNDTYIICMHDVNGGDTFLTSLYDAKRTIVIWRCPFIYGLKKPWWFNIIFGGSDDNIVRPMQT